MILDVVLEMLRQGIDPPGQKSHLHFRRTGVALMLLKSMNEIRFGSFAYHIKKMPF
jgi:hypothetical protein